MEEKDPILLLIEKMTSELHIEVNINSDSNKFWKKAQEHIFQNSLLSFREGVSSLKDGLSEEKDMYNYMSSLVFRIFAQPYTKPALDSFVKGFDETANDSVLGGYTYVAKELSKVEQLLLFMTVHRNLISLALLQLTRDEQEEARTKGRKRG